MKAFERSANTTDAVTIYSAITLNSTTSTKILDANVITNPRFVYRVVNNSAQDVWVKEQAASVDNDKKGFLVPKRSMYESIPDNPYIGEVSAIAVSGTPAVYVTEY